MNNDKEAVNENTAFHFIVTQCESIARRDNRPLNARMIWDAGVAFGESLQSAALARTETETALRMRQKAVTTLELTKGFTPEMREVADNTFRTMEELADAVLYLTAPYTEGDKQR